jgi:gluconolactonase
MDMTKRHSKFCWRADPRASTWLILALASLLACDERERSSGEGGRDPDGAGETARDGGGTQDPSDPEAGASSSQEAGSARDAGLDARVSDAGSSGLDASRDSASSSSDAASNADGTANQSDAGMRAQICGETSSWPAPFAGESIQAQQVGTSSFGFLEGPVWIAEQGVLLFSDMDMGSSGNQGPPARIRRLTPPTSFDVFAQNANSNGLALWGNGVLAATHDTQALSLFNLSNGARTQIPVLAEGKHFNSPNDLTVRSDGTIYFTDPDWQAAGRPNETMKMGVYRIPPPLRTDGSDNGAVLIEGTLNKPNGIALSPDERTLYVGSVGNEIWKYAVASDGSVSNRSMFASTGSSDGMTVDCAGNLYVSSGSVEVFAPDGTRRGQINLGGDPTNVAFGGSDRKTLYITAGSRLYSVALNVPGYPY